jgi:hypothetical protein
MFNHRKRMMAREPDRNASHSEGEEPLPTTKAYQDQVSITPIVVVVVLAVMLGGVIAWFGS